MSGDLEGDKRHFLKDIKQFCYFFGININDHGIIFFLIALPEKVKILNILFEC